MPLSKIESLVSKIDDLELVILVGSQANGTATACSDWDIAIQWRLGLDVMQKLARTETLRSELSQELELSDDKIDLIDIPSAGLAMREQVANHGITIKGDNTHAWSHFLTKTWRQLEEFYWDEIYAV